MSKKAVVVLCISLFAGACSGRKPAIPAVATDTSQAGPIASQRAPGERTTPAGAASPPTQTPAGPPPTAYPTAAAPAANVPVIIPIGDYHPLPLDDPFLQEMLLAGYSLFQAGSIPVNDDMVYAAYVFTRFEVGEPVGEDTFVLAFYRREGDTNHPLGTVFPSAYSPHLPVYPSYYRLANWDDPASALMGLTTVENPDPETRALLHLDGHAADINGNGQPEFIFGGEYCPVSCDTTVQSFDYFEVWDDHVERLGDGLPGHISLTPAFADPLIFEVAEMIPYGASSQILLPAFAAWNGSEFEVVTHQNETLLTERADAHLERLKSHFGEPFGHDELQIDAYSLLLLYERAGLRQQGLDAFLEVTDPQRWAGGNPRMECWLQLSRAHARDEYARNLPFTPLPPLSDFDPNTDVPKFAEALSGSGEDLSACERWSR